MEMKASAVARRAEGGETSIIGFRAEPEPRPLVVNVAAGGGGVGGGGDADKCKLATDSPVC